MQSSSHAEPQLFKIMPTTPRACSLRPGLFELSHSCFIQQLVTYFYEFSKVFNIVYVEAPASFLLLLLLWLINLHYAQSTCMINSHKYNW